MRTEDTDAVHPDPVWRERANFIVGGQLPEGGRTEQLWARQIDQNRFEICCIPFFLYDVALGDIVETDANYDVVRVVDHSGRYVFRVWFGESLDSREDVTARLIDLGALIEWSSARLAAVDAGDEALAQVIADYLAEEEGAGRSTYETGRS